MTWRLRLFDEDGDKIGWAMADPHEFEVDDDLSNADRLRGRLGTLADDGGIGDMSRWAVKDGVAYYEMGLGLGVDESTPRDRLERMGVSLVNSGDVADYELLEE